MKLIRTCSLQRNTVPLSLDGGQILLTLQAATKAWSDATGINLPWMPWAGLTGSAIVFRFGDLSDKQDEAENGGKVIGYCQPLESGNHLITFSDAVAWSLPAAHWFAWIKRVFQRGEDLKTAALHEIGHALGLPHNDEWDSVMNASPEAAGLADHPSARDAARVRQIFTLSDS